MSTDDPLPVAPSRQPEVVDWARAATRIGELMLPLRQHASTCGRSCVVIGISGGVASGKSTLAGYLDAPIIGTDRYLPNYNQLDRALWDHPDSSDLSRLAKDLASLRSGHATPVPVWSFFSHQREGEEFIHPAPVIVLEGLHALHPLLREHVDLRVFVDAPSSVRWERCRAREATGVRGWDLEFVRNFFNEVAEPTFAKFGSSVRENADLLVRNDPVTTSPAKCA